MFCSIYNEEAFVRSKLPTVDNFFNIYHPADLVAYRLEPLIKQFSYDLETGEGKAEGGKPGGYRQTTHESEDETPDHHNDAFNDNSEVENMILNDSGVMAVAGSEHFLF
jgi:hypothetical protein